MLYLDVFHTFRPLHHMGIPNNGQQFVFLCKKYIKMEFELLPENDNVLLDDTLRPTSIKASKN